MRTICLMKKIPLVQVTQHAALFQRGVTISQITKDHYEFLILPRPNQSSYNGYKIQLFSDIAV